MISRRNLLILSVLATGGPAFAGRIPDGWTSSGGSLPEMAVGAADAPLTVVEYASLTCEHCAAFHTDGAWNSLYRRYITPGQVRWIIREFPLDALSAAAFMAARCTGGDVIRTVTGLFAVQSVWAQAPEPKDALAQILERMGLPRERFDACLSDETALASVNQVYEKARAQGLEATPTFLIGQQKLVGNAPFGEFVRRIETELVAR